MIIQKKDKKNEINRLFSDYIPKDTLNRILDDTNDKNTLKIGVLNYILLQVREKPIEDVPQLVSRIVEIINENNGISSIFSSLMLVTFGFPLKKEGDAFSQCKTVAHALFERFQKDIKIVYGTIPGMFCNMGTQNSLQYGPLLSNFSDILTGLMNLNYGEIKDI